MDAPAPAGIATFLDFDGTLARTDLVRVAAYHLRHSGRPGPAAGGTLRLLASIPAFLAMDAWNRSTFARRLFSFYEGMSEDRLERFSDRLHRDLIAPRVPAAVPDFLDRCRRQGPLVLVTGALDVAVRPFAEEHGIEHVLANRLEFRQGRATGRLRPPLLFGSEKARAILSFAAEHGIDLERSAAYADSASDAAMLDAVGRGHVVNPGRRLAATARQAGWRVIEW